MDDPNKPDQSPPPDEPEDSVPSEWVPEEDAAPIDDEASPDPSELPAEDELESQDVITAKPDPGEAQSPPPAEPEQKKDNTRLFNWLLIILGVLFVIAIGYLFYLFIRNTQASKPEPTQTTTAPTPTVAVISDPTWDRIQLAGRIVAATSADYPPFAYYNEQFQLDGFDVALLDEVTKRIGYQQVLQDVAFDGLHNALVIGQIDMAAAAISRTPEREQSLDFSDIYYTSIDAFIVKEGSNITVNTPEDLAGKRIGVQRDTVYQTWVEKNLVEPGLITENQLFAYHTIDPAINDLRLDRIDVVLLDYNVALEYLASGGLEEAGQGLSPQYFAIAMAKGSPTLTAQVNKALAEMRADGTLNQLAEKFFGDVTGVIPPVATPTPQAPPPTPTPAPCVDSMQFVNDLNYDDNDMQNPPVLYPGERFAKGWRLRNTGTCTWDSNYRLMYVSGNTPAAQMGGQPTPVQGTVPPGSIYDMYVQLTAPYVTGVYQGFWQMQNPKGVFFGSRIWVGIYVSPNGTIPPQNPPVIQRYTLEPTQLSLGSCTLADWRIEGNVSKVTLLRNGEVLWDNAPTNANYQDCPGATGTFEYTVQATGPGGNASQTKSAVVQENIPEPTPTSPAPLPPVITSFVVEPPQINVGDCANMNWNVTGEADNIRILRNGEVAFDNLPQQGNGQDCFQSRGQNAYVLEATGQGQTVSAQQNVTVILQANLELDQYLDENNVLVDLLPNSTITMVLNNENMSGNAGCNNYNTTYVINGDEIAIQPAQIGLQLCAPQELMDQEARYIELLGLVNRFEVTGDRLELIRRFVDPNTRQEVDTILLVFERQP